MNNSLLSQIILCFIMTLVFVALLTGLDAWMTKISRDSPTTYQLNSYYNKFLPTHLNKKIYSQIPETENLGFYSAVPAVENIIAPETENFVFVDFFRRADDLYLNVALVDRYDEFKLSEMEIQSAELAAPETKQKTPALVPTHKIIRPLRSYGKEVIVNQHFKVAPEWVSRIINEPSIELKINTDRGYVRGDLTATCSKHTYPHAHAAYNHDHSHFDDHNAPHINEQHISSANYKKMSVCDKLKYAVAQEFLNA